MSTLVTCPACFAEQNVRFGEEIVTCAACKQPFAPAQITKANDGNTPRRAGRVVTSPAEEPTLNMDNHDDSGSKNGHDSTRSGTPAVAGKYRIVEEISRGGMGIVLRGRDSSLHREVAVKVLREAGNAVQKARFVKEAQVTGQLEHPNIVPVHEFGTDTNGRMFFAMKLVRGRTMSSVIAWHRSDPIAAQRDFPLTRLVNMVIQVCNAVAFAHARGVIHRDIKPSNVMVGDFGEVMLMDWGLAKLGASTGVGLHTVEGSTTSPRHHSTTMQTKIATDVDVTESTPSAAISESGLQPALASTGSSHDLTHDGAVIGTPVYMSPEQASGKAAQMDARSDIYALGAMLYEVLTLHPPVSGADLGEVLANAAAGTIIDPLKRAPDRDIPKDLAAVAMKAMAHNPELRYVSAIALRRDLESFLEGRTVSARSGGILREAQRWIQRNRLASAAMAACIVVLLSAAIAGYFANIHQLRQTEAQRLAADAARGDAEKQRQRAEEERKKSESAFERERNLHRLSEQQSHVASIALAGEQIANNEFASARASLDGCPSEYRDWAWRRLDLLCAQQLAMLPSGREPITALATSSDGSLGAAGTADGTVAVYDLRERTLIATRRIHPGAVRGLAIAAGPIVVSGGEDTVVRVWRANTAEAPQALFGNEAAITRLTISDDGRFIASGASNGQIQTWDQQMSGPGRKIGRLGDEITALTVTNERIFAGALDGSVTAWRWSDGAQLASTHIDGRPLAIDQTGSRAFVASQRGGGQIWDLSRSQAGAVLRGSLRELTCAAFNAVGTHVVTGGSDGVARVWECASGREMLGLRGHAGRLAAVAWRSTNTSVEVISGGEDASVRVWDGQRRRDLTERHLERAIGSAVVSPDGQRILTGIASGSAVIWDVASGTLSHSLILGRRVRAVAFSDDGHLAAAAGDNGACRIWSVPEGRTLTSIFCPPAAVLAIAFSHDGERIATAGGDGQVRIWSVADGHEITTCRGHVGAVMDLSFTPDGRGLASVGSDGTTRIFSAASGETIRMFAAGRDATTVAFTPDGHGLLVASDRIVTVLDSETGTKRLELRGHTGAVRRVVVPQGGDRAFTASADGTVRIWDLTSGRCLMVLRDHTSPVLAAQLASDGCTLVTAASDGDVMSYPASAPVK